MTDTITIARRFHGPKRSGNGGYVCGRLASFIEGTARVRLYVPPPLDTPLTVRRDERSVVLMEENTKIAEAWAADLAMDIPEPPSREDAEKASGRFRGFETHRFPTCFVCGPDREEGDGLHIFAGPLRGSSRIACTWTPQKDLAPGDGVVSPEFIWCVLDCPGGFAFPEPETGTILLGELTVARYGSVRVGETYIIVAWEITREGRKHHTATALFGSNRKCLAAGWGTWFEVQRDAVKS